MKLYYLIPLCMILIVGCTTIDHSHIPLCDDINVTGTDCYPTTRFCFDRPYEICNPPRAYENATCKKWEYYGINAKLRFCFDTLENNMEEIKGIFEKCWNCDDDKTIDVKPNRTIKVITDKKSYYEKPQCIRAGDCSSNMNLSGCTYDGCNYCCNNECTVMACWEEPKNISEYNFTFGPIYGPNSEEIPEDYKQIIIYETVCQCKYGVSYCEGWECSCDEYCYNKSKTIWVPGNNCEMPIHCYYAGDT